MKARPHASSYRRRVRPFTPLALLAAFALGTTNVHAGLAHRYSFTADASDSVGAANGTIVDAGGTPNFVFTGSMLDLSANTGQGSNGITEDAYVDLPNGIISEAVNNGVNGAVTVEFWATVAEQHTWQRFGDFGSSNNGENTSASGQNATYILVTPNSGRFGNGLEATNHPASNAAEPGVGLTGPFAVGVPAHVAAVYDHTNTAAGPNGTMTLYLDGNLVGTNQIHPDTNLRTFNDNNNWLGRSQWPDPVFDGSYDEFRVWDQALTADQVSATFTAGPDSVPDFDADFDGDMIPDVYEDQYAFLDKTVPEDAMNDEEPDGLNNLQEFQNGTLPDVADTDMDGLMDGEEVNSHQTNPLVADTDMDGLTDGEEINLSMTLPNDPDSDGDMIPDGYEFNTPNLDPNNIADAGNDIEPDGLTNLEEFNGGTDPNSSDTDLDGLTDFDELNTHGTSPILADTDGDILTDGDEINVHMTLATQADTDGDGLRDNIELHNLSDPNLTDATTPLPFHRYSFNVAPGPATNGSVIMDSIGSADGMIVGDGANFTGTQVALPGGAGATALAAYVDLPNGILSSHETVTFEAWYTMNAIQNWSRIWDFGSTAGGEILGNMGGGEGLDYFMFAPNQGGDINLQRNSTRNNDAAAPGGGVGPVDGDEEALDTALASTLNVEYHVAGVWAADANGGGQLSIYRNGVRQNVRTTTFNATDINDVNNWLGRSNWTGDNYLQGTLNEFRIYEGAMNDAAAAASFAAGPDASLAQAPFVITDFQFDQNTRTATVTFNSVPGASYFVDASGDPLFWLEIEDSLQSQGTETTFTEENIPPSETIRLYRVRRVVP